MTSVMAAVVSAMVTTVVASKDSVTTAKNAVASMMVAVVMGLVVRFNVVSNNVVSWSVMRVVMSSRMHVNVTMMYINMRWWSMVSMMVVVMSVVMRHFRSRNQMLQYIVKTFNMTA